MATEKLYYSELNESPLAEHLRRFHTYVSTLKEGEERIQPVHSRLLELSRLILRSIALSGQYDAVTIVTFLGWVLEPGEVYREGDSRFTQARAEFTEVLQILLSRRD